MISFLGCQRCDHGDASRAYVLEHMVERKLLTKADVRAILGSGIECLEPRINAPTIAEAIRLMRQQMLPLFAE